MPRINEERQKQIDTLVEYMRGCPHGYVFTHSELAEVAGVRYGSSPYYDLIHAAETRLRTSHQRILERQVGRGYRIRYPREHVVAAEKYREAAVQRLDLGIATLDATDLSMLAPHEQQAHEAKVWTMANIRQITNLQQRRKSRWHSIPTPPLLTPTTS